MWDQSGECMFKMWNTHISYGARENLSHVFPHARCLSVKEDDKGNDCSSSHSSFFHFLYCFTLYIPLNIQENRGKNKLRYIYLTLL